MVCVTASMRALAVVLLLACSTADADRDRTAEYAKAKEKAAKARAAWAEKLEAVGARDEDAVAATVMTHVRELADLWMGTTWALGAPQASEPGPDARINCGTFVGTVLRDAGFNVKVTKLQRQPSQDIIRSFVGKDRTRRFSNTPMKKFLAEVRDMGPGLFIIGLDFHVGFLIQTDDDLRFVHASYVTRTVVDEPAAEASPIVDSKYRVVGKILSRENLDDWLKGREIEVVGNW